MSEPNKESPWACTKDLYLSNSAWSSKFREAEDETPERLDGVSDGGIDPMDDPEITDGGALDD